jgi:glycosyltransferase involved in cell wall biosynthesis
MVHRFIIIPAHNEEKTIAKVIEKSKEYGAVIVIDDGSDDRTSLVSHKAGATVLRHIVNLGKGAALKTGCDYAIMAGARTLVAIDADAQHDPIQIPDFVELLKGRDVVFGYRVFSNAMPAILRFGNRAINKFAELLYGIRLYDTQCGYRAFTATAYKKMRWQSHDYSVESEMVSKVGKYGLEFAQIPIETVYQDKYKGTTIFDGVKIVMKMLWWKVN